MFGQTSTNSNPSRSISRTNNSIGRHPTGNDRPIATTNPYRRRFATNNTINRANTNLQLPLNDNRIENNRNNNSVQEINNGMLQNDNETNNLSPELSSDEVSLPQFSYDSPNTNGEDDSVVNNTTPSVNCNPTSQEFFSILNNLPNTPENRRVRNRLLLLATSNPIQSRNNRTPQQGLPGLQGRRDFVRASELINNNTHNVRQNNNSNTFRNTVVTPQNRQQVPRETTPEETDNRVFTPKDKRLISVREALESQPVAVRPILEKISSTVISLSNLIFEKHKTLEVWNNPTNNRIFENLEQEFEVLDEEFYTPNSLKLNNINLKIQHGILSSESYKERVELIKHNFEKIKNKFRVHSSKCAKEIAELKHKSAIERRGQNIIKQFLLMTTHFVRYHKDKTPDIINSSKDDPLFAACVLINFSSSLDDNFFTWAKIKKEVFLKMIVKELGETDEDISNIITTPLLENEKNFAKKLEDEFLSKTFTQLTMKIARIQYENKQLKEDNKNLRNIIRSNDLEQLTAATNEGLNNINILESRESLENFLQDRDKVLERKLFTKFKQQQKLKNSQGPHKQNKRQRNTPVGNANKQGSTLRNSNNSSKIKRNGRSFLTQQQQTVTFKTPQKLRQQQKQKTKQKQKEKEKTIPYKQRNQPPNHNKRRRENQEGLRYERRGGWQKRRRK